MASIDHPVSTYSDQAHSPRRSTTAPATSVSCSTALPCCRPTWARWSMTATPPSSAIRWGLWCADPCRRRRHARVDGLHLRAAGGPAVHPSGRIARTGRVDGRSHQSSRRHRTLGRNADFWNGEGLGQIGIPLMLIAGSVDDVSRYDAIRRIFAETTGTTRHLLTFENANHNAGAPHSGATGKLAAGPHTRFCALRPLRRPGLGQRPDEQHHPAFRHGVPRHPPQGDVTRETFLDLVPNAIDGVDTRDGEGNPIAGNTYWAGFPPRTAVGLRFETLNAGE